MSVLLWEKHTLAYVLNKANTKSPAWAPNVFSGTVTSNIVVYDGRVKLVLPVVSVG